jgi:hypothetical protein
MAKRRINAVIASGFNISKLYMLLVFSVIPSQSGFAPCELRSI